MTRTGTDKRRLPEAELSGPVQEWLEDEGLVVYCEVPHYGGCIDLVGHRPSNNELIGVELKTSLTSKLINQAVRDQTACSLVYVAVATQPRASSLAECRKFGLGVLSVQGGQVSEVLAARDRDMRPLPGTAQRLLQRIRLMEPGGTGGKPCLAGDGPAQACQRAIDAYLAEHPGATWKELYESIPNHYANARSMQSAMRSNRERLAFRERMKARRTGS